jgi:acyl carrier protein
MTENEVTQGVLSYIRSEIAYPGTEVTEGTELFESGVLDSLMLLRLVLHLESTYAISFAPDDLKPSVFGRVPSLTSLVLRKIEQRP